MTTETEYCYNFARNSPDKPSGGAGIPPPIDQRRDNRTEGNTVKRRCAKMRIHTEWEVTDESAKTRKRV